MADSPNYTNDVTLWDEDRTKAVTITTDGAKERLDVDARIIEDADPFKGKYVFEYLKNTGSKDMNVNGSVTPVDFTSGPGTGKKWFITRLILSVEGSSINHTKFGSLSALTNGISIKVTESGVERDVLGFNIKKNADFWNIMFDVAISSAATDILSARWTFGANETVLRLLESTSDNIKITVNDNLTGLTTFRTNIQGFEVDE